MEIVKNENKINVVSRWLIVFKIGTTGVHVSTARESEMCYSLGTSIGDVTRLNVANVRFSLYI